MNKITFFIFVSFFLQSCSLAPVQDRQVASYQTCLEMMNSIIQYTPYYGYGTKSFQTAKSLDALEALYGNESLIDIQLRLSQAEIKSNNKHVVELLNSELKLEAIEGKNLKSSEKDAQVIYEALDNNFVHRNDDCYDPKGTIGFCFGRATIAHMEAIVRNTHPGAIRKIWIAGDMGKWGHHVATMIYTVNGWRVLDTNLGKVVTVDVWLKTYMPMKQGPKDIMVFVTQAGRFGPYDNKPYNAIDLFNTQSEDYDRAKDFFQGYFYDYFESLDNIKNKPLITPKKSI